jgi:hypothetical protein
VGFSLNRVSVVVLIEVGTPGTRWVLSILTRRRLRRWRSGHDRGPRRARQRHRSAVEFRSDSATGTGPGPRIVIAASLLTVAESRRLVFALVALVTVAAAGTNGHIMLGFDVLDRVSDGHHVVLARAA